MAKKLLEGFGSTRRICAVVETTWQTIKFDTKSLAGTFRLEDVLIKLLRLVIELQH